MHLHPFGERCHKSSACLRSPLLGVQANSMIVLRARKNLLRRGDGFGLPRAGRRSCQRLVPYITHRSTKLGVLFIWIITI